jgi:hypothetical protein
VRIVKRDQQVARRVRQALAQYYFLDEHPAERFGPHLFWHGPFLEVSRDASQEERRARVGRAGEIWLRNKDFGCEPMLIISDLEGHESWVFRRPRRPGERAVIVGPAPIVIVTSGREIGFVRYAETELDSGDALLAGLARGGRDT